MTTRYVTPDQATGCGCTGCGPTQGDCAGGCGCLPCLRRPRFYCGMVLTDDHLNDLGRWVRQRLALGRFVDGWGTVAGLEVGRRREDPRSVVIVGRGYARGCCGEDIVLCEEARLDVCDCRTGGPCCAPSPAPAAGTPTAVDVYLVPVESPVDPVRVASSCGCDRPHDPEHERVLETGVLRCVPVADPTTDRVTLEAAAWKAAFVARARVVDEYEKALGPAAASADAARWLIAWIDRQDVGERTVLGSCRDRLDVPSVLDGTAAIDPVTELFDIVQALRRHHVETTFAGCDDPPGVLLARVWTARDADGVCTVECIDAHPPYRRVLSPPGWPCPPGMVNAAAALWQRWAVAQPRLLAMGLTVSSVGLKAPDDVAGLRAELAAEEVYLPFGATVTASLYRDRCGHWDAREPDDGRVVRLAPRVAQRRSSARRKP